MFQVTMGASATEMLNFSIEKCMKTDYARRGDLYHLLNIFIKMLLEVVGYIFSKRLQEFRERQWCFDQTQSVRNWNLSWQEQNWTQALSRVFRQSKSFFGS